MDVLSRFGMILEGFQMDLGSFWQISGGPGGVRPRLAEDFRPPKESRFSGEGGICGEVRKVGGRTPTAKD